MYAIIIIIIIIDPQTIFFVNHYIVIMLLYLGLWCEINVYIIIINVSTAGVQAFLMDHRKGERAITHHAGPARIGGCVCYTLTVIKLALS
jgi:hypothetical protein